MNINATQLFKHMAQNVKLKLQQMFFIYFYLLYLVILVKSVSKSIYTEILIIKSIQYSKDSLDKITLLSFIKNSNFTLLLQLEGVLQKKIILKLSQMRKFYALLSIIKLRFFDYIFVNIIICIKSCYLIYFHNFSIDFIFQIYIVYIIKMLSEIINQKQQYIKSDTITLSDFGIQTIGYSNTFKNITKLHLTGNKIVKLDGLEQFTNLQYLNLSNNQIESIKEFQHVPQSLQCLFVAGNPFTSNLNYGYSLMCILMNLQQLDNDKINRQLTQEYQIKMQTYGFHVLAYFVHFNNKQLTPIFNNRSINYIQKLLMIIDQLENENKDEIQGLCQQLQNLQFKKSIADIILKHICKFERDQFKSNNINIFFANQAMQSQHTDLQKFADDEGYYQQEVLQAFISYEDNQQFPTFSLNQAYNLGILDFIYQSTLTQNTTFRPQEDRIKQYVEPPQQNFSLINKSNASVQKSILKPTSYSVSTQSKFDECTQEYLNNYKKQYPFLKGFEQLKKTLQKYYLQEFKLKLKKKINRLNQQCIAGTFKLDYFKKLYQRYLMKIALQQINRKSKISNMINILSIQRKHQQLLSIKHIKSVVYVQKNMANLQRQIYLKRAVFRHLNPKIRYGKIAKKLQLKLIILKINGILREALKQIKITALTFKVEIRKDLAFQVTLKKEKKQESRALENFRKLRELGNTQY
ncbi:unnamed protein product [Paramecium primaurelia]|uniref:Uncharacterized protein n=1 Tax=Paramecium primaurelia TaxID=5886 RepID=A0A8S1PBU1_PARPR|nr:unnamed protein product [Paramecium primaurelia]